MKKLFAFALCAVMLLCCMPRTFATLPEMVLNEGQESTFRPNEEPKQWSFTPAETGEYILFGGYAEYIEVEILGQTAVKDPTMSRGKVVTLTGGQQYTVQAYLKQEYYAEYPSGYMDMVRIEKKQPLQRLYFFENKITGNQYEVASFQAFAEPDYYKVENLTWKVSDSTMAEIMDVYDNCCNVRLKKTGTVTVTATMQGKSAQCEVTVEGMLGGEWESYPQWPAESTRQSVTVVSGLDTNMRYTPASDGWYAFYTESGDIHGDIRHASSAVNVPYKMANTGTRNVMLYQLTAGDVYIIGIGMNKPDATSASGTMVLEKAKSTQKVELTGPNGVSGSTIVGYVGGMQDLLARTDPDYSFALTGNGFTFTSSDPSVAQVETAGNVGDPGCTILLVGPGTCTITVSAGGKETVCQVTVLEPPKLEVGKTVTLQHNGHAVGTTLSFTPTKSGNYTFTVTGAGGTCSVKDTSIGMYFYNGTGTMSGYLQAGRTYSVELYIEGSRHTVTVSSGNAGGSGNGNTGNSGNTGGSGGDIETPTQPTGTGGTEPSQNETQPVNPTEPSVTPSEPTATEGAPTVQAPVQMEDGKATVDSQQLQQLLDSMQPGDVLVLNAEEFAVTALTMSKDILEKITAADVVLTVKLPTVGVTLDTAALAAISGQAGAEVTLQCELVGMEGLTSQQQAALEEKTVESILQLELESNGGLIHDFKGGVATIQLNNAAGTTMEVYYLAPDGTMEKLEATQTGGLLTFQTGHFSEYVLIPQAQENNIWLPIVLAAAAVLMVGGAVATLLLRKKAAKKAAND